jgi:hypothetical protein
VKESPYKTYSTEIFENEYICRKIKFKILGIPFLSVTVIFLCIGYLIRKHYRKKKVEIESLPFDFEKALMEIMGSSNVLK